MLVADDARSSMREVEFERIDRRIDAELGDLPRQHRRRVEWAKEVAGAGSVRSSAGT